MKFIFNDIELVERLQKGDVEAFDKLYEEYSRKLYIFGLKYLKNREEAEGLVQSVYLKIWENRKYLKKESSFRSFIFTIAFNDICKIFRRREYLKKFVIENLNEDSETSYEAEERIDYHSALERVKQIMEDLPEKHRNVFIKSRMEGKSTKEIAKELKLSPGTVDNYVSESLKFIRLKMKSEDVALILLITLFFL